MKSFLTCLIAITMMMMLFGTQIFAQEIENNKTNKIKSEKIEKTKEKTILVVPFSLQIGKQMREYKNFGQEVAELMEFRLRLTEGIKTIPYSVVQATINKANNKSNIKDYKSKDYVIDYVITGEIRLEQHRVIMNSKILKLIQNKYNNSKELKFVGAFQIQSKNITYLLDIIESSIEVLLGKIGIPNKNKKKSNLRTDIDLMFLIEGTKGMNIVHNVLKDEILKFRQEVMKWNYANRIRISALDYKEKSDIKNFRFLDFTENTNKLDKFIDDIIVRPGLTNEGDLEYALKIAINKATWSNKKDDLKSIFIITRNNVLLSEDFCNEIINNCIQLGIKVHILGCAPFTDEVEKQYIKIIRKTGGFYKQVSYRFAFFNKKGKKESIIYNDGNVYYQKKVMYSKQWKTKEHMDTSNLVDISLGRSVGNPEDTKSFLEKESFEFSDDYDFDTQKPDANPFKLIQLMLQRHFKVGEDFNYPRLYLRCGKRAMWVILGNQKAINDFERAGYKVGDEIYLLSEIVPTNNNFYFNINPENIQVIEFDKSTEYGISNNSAIKSYILRKFSDFLESPYYYYEHGLFYPKKWGFKAKIEKIENNGLK